MKNVLVLADIFQGSIRARDTLRYLARSLGPHTLAKLQAKNPQRSVDFDKTFWPSAADMDALRQEDDWRRVAKEYFSVENIRKYFARSPPLSAQDADGWRPREHVGFFVQRGR